MRAQGGLTPSRAIIASATEAGQARRIGVSNYLRGLVRGTLMAKGLEGADILVLPFGSVPLMTFLPDGDNDLAVCLPAGLPSRPYIDKVIEALEEEQGKVVPGLFPVQDVTVVNAEVQVRAPAPVRPVPSRRDVARSLTPAPATPATRWSSAWWTG